MRPTQVVWADTVRIGCGVARSTVPPVEPFLVCNYSPGGNFLGQRLTVGSGRTRR